MTTFGPLMGTVIDPVAFTTWAMREMGIKQPEQFLNPQGAQAYMMSQQMQQQRNGMTGQNAPQPNQQGGPPVAPPSNSQGQPIEAGLMSQLEGQAGNSPGSLMSGVQQAHPDKKKHVLKMWLFWLHVVSAVGWGLLLIPTLLFWPNSVLLVIFMSAYTIILDHAIGAQEQWHARRERKRIS
jgi:hypothetical protein